MLVCDLSLSYDSSTEEWISSIIQNMNKNSKLILLGNKFDKNKSSCANTFRLKTKEKGIKYAEVSTKSG